MILLIDNYDSFVHNLGRYVGRLGQPREVVRNDKITMDEIARLDPAGIIISPGPCTPREAGISMNLIKSFCHEIPILGICLGHQCIGEAFGGRTVRAPYPCHGRSSLIHHDGEDIFMGLPNPLEGARYHSLVTKLPANTPLQVTAHIEDERTIMGVKHRDLPVYGLQFHPESILTDFGHDLLRNFITLADQFHERKERRKNRKQAA